MVESANLGAKAKEALQFKIRLMTDNLPANLRFAADQFTEHMEKVTEHGKIETGVLVTDEMVAGTVAIPQGWGHRGGGWHLANTVPGANVNELTSNRPEDLEALAGMAVLNGVAVRLESV